MWPAPIKVTVAQLPSGAIYRTTLDSGEKLYTHEGRVYAVQPAGRRHDGD